MLHNLPEFFKPKELFCSIGNNQAQEETEKLLQGCEIENDTISCTDGTELQVLIASVKRLLQLLPQIKDNVKRALLSYELVNCFYRDETRRYVEQINESPLHFKVDNLYLSQFLNSDEKKYFSYGCLVGMCGEGQCMDRANVWTGVIKVHQVLENTLSMTDRLSESLYTILILQHLLLVDGMFSLNTLLQSTRAPHLLMVWCDTNQLLKCLCQYATL